MLTDVTKNFRLLNNGPGNVGFSYSVLYDRTTYLKKILTIDEGQYFKNRFYDMFSEIIPFIEDKQLLSNETKERISSYKDKLYDAVLSELGKLANNSYKYIIDLPEDYNKTSEDNYSAIMITLNFVMTENSNVEQGIVMPTIEADYENITPVVTTMGFRSDNGEDRTFPINIIKLD